MPVELASEPTADGAVLNVTGDLDIATAHLLREAVGDLMGQGVRHVEVDLAACTFLDSCGMGALLWATHRLHAIGGDLAAVHASVPAARTLEISGVDQAVVVRT